MWHRGGVVNRSKRTGETPVPLCAFWGLRLREIDVALPYLGLNPWQRTARIQLPAAHRS
jgi:hypothetical protein